MSSIFIRGSVPSSSGKGQQVRRFASWWCIGGTILSGVNRIFVKNGVPRAPILKLFGARSAEMVYYVHQVFRFSASSRPEWRTRCTVSESFPHRESGNGALRAPLFSGSCRILQEMVYRMHHFRHSLG